MSEHRISKREADLLPQNALMLSVLDIYGLRIELNDDGGFTVHRTPMHWCAFCGETIIRAGEAYDKNAIMEHTNNCERNPLVQEVRALRAAARNASKWQIHMGLPTGLGPALEQLDEVLHHIYDGSETDGPREQDTWPRTPRSDA